jgi:LAGLIDADG DNA endonuclease family protein
LDPAKAELLGFLAAEGNEYHYSRSHDRFFADRGPAGKWYRINYRQNAIEFTNVEPVIQQRFYDLLVKAFGKQKSSFGRRYRIRIRQKKMVSDLLHHSRLGSLQWQVPSEVLNSKNEKVKAAWCRGYADGDGTARPYEVDFDSANRPGLEHVQGLLQSLGISSRLKGPYHRAPYLDRFTLTIPKKNLSRYSELIGFNHPSRKQRLYEALRKETPVDRES